MVAVQRFITCLLILTVLTGCVSFQTGGEDESAAVGQAMAESVVEVQELSEGARLYTIEGAIISAGGEASTYTRKEIEYERDGETIKGTFYEEMMPALEWIKQDTPDDATFLMWWDYGKTLEGYTGRRSVVIDQSMAIMKTVSKFANMSDEELEAMDCRCDPDEVVRDVAIALMAEDPDETATIMKNYSADYLLVHEENRVNFWAIVFASRKNVEDYSENHEPTERAFGTTVFRAINHEELEGFDLVYIDEKVVIYRLRE